MEQNIKVTLSATLDSSKHVVPLATGTLSRITRNKETGVTKMPSELNQKRGVPRSLTGHDHQKGSTEQSIGSTAVASPDHLTQSSSLSAKEPALTSSSLKPQSSLITPTAASGDAKHLNNPRPTYPQESRDNEEEGTVILSVYVLANGGVGDIKLQRSSGFFRLDDAALQTVRTRWKFIPATENGQAINSWHTQRIHFSLG